MKCCSYSYRTLIIGNQIFEFLFEIDIHLQGLSVWWIIKSLHFRKVFKLKEVAQLLKDVSNISWVNLNSLFFINFISFSLFVNFFIFVFYQSDSKKITFLPNLIHYFIKYFKSFVQCLFNLLPFIIIFLLFNFFPF